jgi:hypothetical protein
MPTLRWLTQRRGEYRDQSSCRIHVDPGIMHRRDGASNDPRAKALTSDGLPILLSSNLILQSSPGPHSAQNIRVTQSTISELRQNRAQADVHPLNVLIDNALRPGRTFKAVVRPPALLCRSPLRSVYRISADFVSRSAANSGHEDRKLGRRRQFFAWMQPRIQKARGRALSSPSF